MPNEAIKQVMEYGILGIGILATGGGAIWLIRYILDNHNKLIADIRSQMEKDKEMYREEIQKDREVYLSSMASVVQEVKGISNEASAIKKDVELLRSEVNEINTMLR